MKLLRAISLMIFCGAGLGPAAFAAMNTSGSGPAYTFSVENGTAYDLMMNTYGQADYGIAAGLSAFWSDKMSCAYAYDDSDSAGTVGHYTQYVRADSRYVGCTISLCPIKAIEERPGTNYDWAKMDVICTYAGGQFRAPVDHKAKTVKIKLEDCMFSGKGCK